MTMITENKEKDFFKFTPQHLEVARNLKVNELKLWLYLSLLDPFGDRSIDLPPLEEIEEKTGLKKSAYYKARTKLESLGLWNFTEKKTIANNLFSRLFRRNKTNSVNKNSIPEKSDSIREKSENSLINQDSIPEKSENQSPEPLPNKEPSILQTIQTYSDLSDLSEEKDKNNTNNIQKDRLMDEGIKDNGLTESKLIDQEIKEENTVPCSPSVVPSEDEKLKNEEFIRYAMSKLPKARDIKRYLMTKDKTTGDRILERIWLEYQQWKTGKTSPPNSTGSEYFDNLIEEYRKTKAWEEFNWDLVDWTKLPCYDLWLNKAQNCRVDYTFIEDNGLGFTRNLRTIFFRWFEQEGNRELETGNSGKEISINPQGMGLINVFKHIMGGDINYGY